MSFDEHKINYSINSPSRETCMSTPSFNSTIIPDVFNRIPATFLINLIGFFILVILFVVLRKKAWNYGRLALLHKNDNSRWMELFYGEHDEFDTAVIPAGENSVNAKLSRIDNGYFSWIKAAFKITDKELLSRAGPDGLLYVSFQRHLIILTTMMLFVSLFIALPINYSGRLQEANTAFSHTTMSNLDPSSAWMWVHTIIILSYLPIGVFLMRRYMKQVHETRPPGEIAARTLLISDIPKEYCNINSLMQYFHEAFPTLQVTDITLAHDIQRLSELDSQRDCAEQARLYCENYNRRRESLKLYPHSFGQIIGCCCNKIDALDFYTQEEIRLTALFEEEKKVSLSKPLGVAFVTVSTADTSRTLRRQLRSSTSNTWIVEQAPSPSDIFWENLCVPKPCWYFNAVLINLALAIFLFFATTPMFVVTLILSLKILPEFPNYPIIYSFSATLLLVSVTALMPVLVAKSESLVRHWTKSGLNRAVMKKTLIFLLVVVLIFPSLGLTTAESILRLSAGDTNRLECVFLADQGAFFVNYIITSALLGSALELVRFPELALYTIRLCLARSRAERVHVRKAVVWDFPLGAHYAWLLLVFTMTTVYSVACPLITPFGLLYLLLKHLIDRHNLCFAYGPSVGGGQLAGTATKALGVAPILAQLAFLSLGLVRRGLSPLAGVQLIGLTTSILGLVTGIILPASKPKEQIPKRDLTAGHFVPPVLRKSYPTVPTEEIQSGTSNNTTETTSTPEGTPEVIESPTLYQNYNLNIC